MDKSFTNYKTLSWTDIYFTIRKIMLLLHVHLFQGNTPFFDPISGSMYNSDHFSLPEEDLSSARDLSDYSQQKEEHISPVGEDPTSYGPVRRMWEGLRDVCYIVQDSKSFQNLTIGIIIANAIILAIVW